MQLHKQTVNKLICFGFKPLIFLLQLFTPNKHWSLIFLQCSACASYEFGTENWQLKSLYFISSVFTVTVTALTFRKNSYWLALPFVHLLLGTNRHDCNQTLFFSWIYCNLLVTLRALDGRNLCVSCKVMVFAIMHGFNCI